MEEKNFLWWKIGSDNHSEKKGKWLQIFFCKQRLVQTITSKLMNLKGGNLIVVAILSSRMEASYYTSRLFWRLACQVVLLNVCSLSRRELNHTSI